jgi:hypothetical protein
MFLEKCLVSNLISKLLSFIHPTERQDVVVAGKESWPVGKSGRKLGILPGCECVTYKAWPDATYDFVGIDAKQDDDGVVRTVYRFHDPVSKKDFFLAEELVNILLYKTK